MRLTNLPRGLIARDLAVRHGDRLIERAGL